MTCMGFPNRLSLVAIAVAVPLPAFADALQQQVLAGTRSVTEADFAFTQTIANQRSGEPAKEVVLRFDPRRAKGGRWTLVSTEGRAPTTKESAEVAKQGENGVVPSYARIARWFGAPATRVAASADKVTYRFSALPKGTLKLGSHDASADTVAEAIVNIGGAMPYVERVRFTTTKPFRMMLVAKVERMDSTTIYRLMPDGRPVIAGSTADMSGSMLGKSGSFKLRTSFSDMRAVR